MERKSAHASLIALVTVLAALVAGLHMLGTRPGMTIDWANPIAWFESSDPELALAAGLRSVGLAVAYWVMATTSLYAVAARPTARRAPRLIRFLTLPGIRRVVDRALATALVASVAALPAAPAIAQEQPPPPPPVVLDVNPDGIPVPHVRLAEEPTGRERTGAETSSDIASPDQVTPTPIPTSGGASTPTPPQTTAVAEGALPSVAATAGATHTVEEGDNLWSIADRHLVETLGSEPAIAALTAYWRTLIDANTPTLRSGDPNLIYPGEIIELPEVAP